MSANYVTCPIFCCVDNKDYRGCFVVINLWQTRIWGMEMSHSTLHLFLLSLSALWKYGRKKGRDIATYSLATRKKGSILGWIGFFQLPLFMWFFYTIVHAFIKCWNRITCYQQMPTVCTAGYIAHINICYLLCKIYYCNK